MILTIRTDKPEAEIGLFELDGTQLEYEAWEAHRELETTLLTKLDDLLSPFTKQPSDPKFKGLLTGIIVFAGPGSFTGLRIGTTVANAMAYTLEIPVTNCDGDDWIKQGMEKLSKAQPGSYVVPEYGAPPNITKPRK